MDQKIEELFEKADDLMINQANHAEAVSLFKLFESKKGVTDNKCIIICDQQIIYSEIVNMDGNNIDALNSLAMCLRHSSAQSPKLFSEMQSLY